MKSKLLLIVLSIFIASCSNSDDNNDDSLSSMETFIITIDKDTVNEILIDIDDPDSILDCVTFDFTIPDGNYEGILISNFLLSTPDNTTINEETINIGDTVLDSDMFPIFWGFEIVIDNKSFEATSGILSITEYDDSNFTTIGDIVFISGSLDVVVTEIGGSETRTILISFNDVESEVFGAC
ncbi:hypothetical protein RM697_08365 [Ichthyenterobacterium sp. W332]|uniref:Uncharacterized protein n=1 Tax=Microcosmobacter mediterraneus TaxID=3075607 RepID=A0ABU2YKS3_9FLAO|nr:hypothetical protein [Ichthyenterobacterium sp. W332]MDT0558657.1 hypothetical protein [Ichthyenterobacterium sp. W332]